MSEVDKEYGSLIVYFNEKWQGQEVIVTEEDSIYATKKWHANVVSRIIDGQAIYAAIFPRLVEGKYYVHTSNWYGGHEAEIDFRNKTP